MSEIKIKKHSEIYRGYNLYSKYNIEVPSFKTNQDYIALNNREILETTDAVHILIYSKAIDSFVFCQQFRCGAFLNNQNEDPFLLECIAGAIDPGDTPVQSAIKEVKEEAGLTIDTLTMIIEGFSSPGVMTEKAYIFFATVVEKPTSIIGGLECESEEILTHVIDRKTTYQMMDQNQFKDCKTLLALYWFRNVDQKQI